MNKYLLTGVVMLGALGMSCKITAASSDDNPSPQPPFLQPTPEWASWVIVVVPKQAGENKNAAPQVEQLVKVQVNKTGKIKQEINTWSDGQTSETWTINEKTIVENAKDHSLTLIDPAHNLSAPYYLRYDLSMLSWVSLNTYVCTETHANHRCYLYKNSLPNNGPDGAPVPSANARYANESVAFSGGFASPSAQAWIDVETHQVVSVDDGTATYDFTYGPSPTAELVLPPKFEKLWQSFEDAMNPLKNQLPPTH